MRNRCGFTIVAAMVLLLAGCARPDAEPAAAPASRTAVVSAAAVKSPPVAVPMPVRPSPHRSEVASCARGARAVPTVDPSASFDLNDPKQRRLRSLAEQNRPTPTRGVVPPASVPGAEACVRVLRAQLSLLSVASSTVPGDEAIRAILSAAGLTKVAVGPGAAFAGSTGAVCVHGTLTGPETAFAIGPLTADRSCRPGA